MHGTVAEGTSVAWTGRLVFCCLSSIALGTSFWGVGDMGITSVRLWGFLLRLSFDVGMGGRGSACRSAGSSVNLYLQFVQSINFLVISVLVACAVACVARVLLRLWWGGG